MHADEDDQKRAERALRDDKALPLAEILKRVSPVLDGKVIGIEFEEDDGRFVYEFKVLSAKGKIREMVVDARSGEILKEEDD
ncbi:PepSY domain-containing protein [Pannonibacter phragmitetus]|uniref:PepSY domain-containing protein n=1 Tax=Pannonibacter phragmitetus TaxID=121719 RepID=UPI003D2F111F